MHFSADEILTWVAAVGWPFVRISAMLLAAPILGARYVNVRMRLGLALLLAIVVAPQVAVRSLPDPLSVGGVAIALEQVVIGVAMGFILQMVFSALTQAGESVALSMGLGFASAVDPVAGVQVPMISQYFMILGTLVFLALNGHLILLELLFRSFETLPLAAGGLTPDDLWRLVGFGSTMFAGAVLLALPAVATLLLVNLAMGVVTRAAPQLNIFAVGFPVTILAGFLILLLTLSSLPVRLGELLMDAFPLIQRVLRL